MENLVYHYTDETAFKHIVKENINLMATRYDFLNDPHEQTWAKEVVLKHCIDNPQMGGLSKVQILRWFAKYSYILSLCDKNDYRTMWRFYGKDGMGVTLAFDADIFEEESIKNSQKDPQHSFDVYDRVIYSSKKKIDFAISYWLHRGVFLRNPNDPADEMMNLCAFIKDEDFDIEHEMRYARIRENASITMKYNPSSVDSIDYEEHEDDKDVLYRKRNGSDKQIPYLMLKFPPQLLKKVTIGYQIDFEEKKQEFRTFLDRFGDLYKHVVIEKSLL